MIDISVDAAANAEDEERKKSRSHFVGPSENKEVEGSKAFKPFIEFTSKKGDNKFGELLVTKNEFEEILRKNYLEGQNKIYGKFSVCKMTLRGNEEIKIGDSEIKEQYFIDINDKKNDIRFFIDADAYENLKKYKDELYDKFKSYLNSQTSSEIDGITQQINDFNSLSDITTAHSPGATDTVAQKLNLVGEEKIAKKAQDLTELYINKRFARGKMSTETEGSEEKFGFFKVVKNKNRPKDIRVYKSEEKTKLKILNVSVSNNEIIQFKTSDSGEIESGRYFKRTNEYAVFQRVDPQDFSSDSKGTKIRIFNEKTGDNNKKTMERFKINVGTDDEESFLKSKKEIVFVEKVIELDDSDSAKIDIGNNIKIIRDKDKLTIKYGDNKLCNSLSLLSSYHGGFFSNNKPRKVEDRDFNLKAHSSIVEKMTPEPSCLKSSEAKHHSVILKILDKKNGSFSYVELAKKGSWTSPLKSTYTAKILEKSFVERFNSSSGAYDMGR